MPVQNINSHNRCFVFALAEVCTSAISLRQHKEANFGSPPFFFFNYICRSYFRFYLQKRF